MSRITPQAGENSDSIRNYAVEAINAVFALHKPNPTIEDGPRGSSPLKSSRDPATIHIFLLSMFFSLNLIFRVVVLGITDDNYYTKYEYGSIATVLVLTAMSWGAFWIKSYPPRHVLSYWVEDILAISICIILGVLLVVRQSMGSCNTPRSLMQDYCNHLYDEHYLPQTPLLLLAIFPLHLQAIFPTLKPTTVILCTILAMGFLIGTLIGSGARNSILAVVQATIINIWACWGRSNVTTSREIWTGVSSSNVEILQHDTKEDRASTHFEWRALLATLGTDMKKPIATLANACDMLGCSLKQMEAMTRSSAMRPELEVEIQSAQASVQSVRSITAVMNMLLNRCVDYAKASHGVRLVPFMEAVNVWDCLTRAVDCIRDLQPTSCVSILPLPPEVNPLIRTDQQWLLENTLCLVANAVKYSEEKSIVVVRPQLEYVESILHLLISVEDRGGGIPELLREILFEEEFCHLQRLSGGTGLGLFALARRVEALGGQYGMHPRNDDDFGSVFWFSVPYLPIEEPPAIALDRSMQSQEDLAVHVRAISNNPLPPADMDPQMQNLRVLLVTASDIDSRQATTCLDSDDYLVVNAGTPEEAMEHWQYSDFPFDAVLVDGGLPNRGGFETARRIRVLEEERHKISLLEQNMADAEQEFFAAKEFMLSNIPYSSLENGEYRAVRHSPEPAMRRQFIIGCFDFVDEDIIREASAVGMDAYISKPFTLQQFNKVVIDHFHGSFPI